MPLCISTASTQIIVAVINQLIVRFYQVDSQSMLAYDGAYLNSRVNEDVSVTARFIYITVPNFIANLVTIGGVGIFLAAFNIKILGLFTLFIVLYMLVFFLPVITSMSQHLMLRKSAQTTLRIAIVCLRAT